MEKYLSVPLTTSLKKEGKMNAEVKRYWNKLREHELANAELIKIIRNVQPLQNAAWKRMKGQNPTAEEMLALLASPSVLTYRLADKIIRHMLTLDLTRRQAGELYKLVTLSGYGSNYRVKIAKIVLALRPSVYHLCDIMCFIPSLKGKAARILLNRRACTPKHLAMIMSHVKALRSKAWQKLLKLDLGSDPSHFEALQYLFGHMPEYKEKAWEYMQRLDLHLTYIHMASGQKDLCIRIGRYILEHRGEELEAIAEKSEAFSSQLEFAKSDRRARIMEVYKLLPELREQAIRTLLDFGPSIGNLRFIILHTEYFREEAAQRLLEQKKCSTEDALQIMERFVSLRQQAWQTLLSKNPSIEELKKAGKIKGYARKAREAIANASKEQILVELERITKPR